MLNAAADDLKKLIRDLKKNLNFSSEIFADKDQRKSLNNISEALCLLVIKYQKYCLQNNIQDDTQWKRFKKILKILQQNYDKIFLHSDKALKTKILNDEAVHLAKLKGYNTCVINIINFASKVNKRQVLENKLEQVWNDFSRKEAIFFSLSFAFINSVILSTLAKEKEISGMECLLYGFIIGGISGILYKLHREYSWREILKDNSSQLQER